MDSTGTVRGERALESVWDYPLPPAVEPSEECAQVVLNGFLIAESTGTLRVLQTGIAPSYYFPPEDVRTVYLRPNGEHTQCAYRGRASYYDVLVGDREVHSGAWTYHDPLPGFEAIADHIAFYPGRMDACFVDGAPVVPDEADAGGWVTSRVQGLSRGYPRAWDRTEDT